ncbi:MAG: YtxH domain-containing protein [Anaerolineales bacterium]|jgi:gas vesicle protein|nr:YtxH domain-containing protein [Anaerolineales bacterium]
MSDNNDFGSFFAGLIVGGLVGAAVALLMAPQSGEETRAVIRDRGIELKEKAVEYGQGARERALEAVEEARLRADRAIEELRQRTEELAQVARERAAAIQSQISHTLEETPPGEAPSEAEQG